MCYRDTTFCASPGCRNACGRYFGDGERAGADRWAGNLGLPAPLVAFGFFCDVPEDGNLPAASETKMKQEPISG